MPEIVEILDDVRKRGHFLILLDTIEYLERGGRAIGDPYSWTATGG